MSELAMFDKDIIRGFQQESPRKGLSMHYWSNDYGKWANSSYNWRNDEGRWSNTSYSWKNDYGKWSNSESGK